MCQNIYAKINYYYRSVKNSQNLYHVTSRKLDEVFLTNYNKTVNINSQFKMDILNKDILNYARKYTSKPSQLLQELERETQYKILMPRMLSGHLMGSMLQFLSYIKQPQNILEIGTYTGYSAICLAQGLREDGHLHTIEINENEIIYLESQGTSKDFLRIS